MKDTILFLTINNVGNTFTGGDRIFTELLKGWQSKLNVILLGSEEVIAMIEKQQIGGLTTRLVDRKNFAEPYDGIVNLFKHTFRRIYKGIQGIFTHWSLLKQVNYVYSASDFYPDMLPGLLLKIFSRRITWIAGYYLFAPFPFSKKSPYNQNRQWLRGLLYWFMQIPSFFLVKWFADIVFVTSLPDQRKFVSSRRPCSKVIVVQGGVDITESERYLSSESVVPFEQREFDACFVGRLHFQKGVKELIDIWAEVIRQKADAKLAMIGDGALEATVSHRIRELGLDENIFLMGFMDGQEKFEVFKQSKLMVHPATYDSGGMAAAEGMAWGLPGVSFDLEALKTYYPKGMLKTSCFDTQEFARNILRLLRDPALYDRFARDAHDLIVETWDWKKRARMIYEKVFESN